MRVRGCEDDIDDTKEALTGEEMDDPGIYGKGQE